MLQEVLLKHQLGNITLAQRLEMEREITRKQLKPLSLTDKVTSART